MINICIVAILWLGGDRIGAGYMENRRYYGPLTEYSILILFYIIMAQMVIILPAESKGLHPAYSGSP